VPSGDPWFAGRRVLVTGASGFVGTALCDRLRHLGADVNGVSRRPVERDGVHCWVADLAEADAARQVVRDVEPEVVFHLASLVTGSRAIEAVAPTVRDNLLTTVHLLTAACEVGGPRVVLAGSMEEPDLGDPEPTPVSPYAAAKYAATTYARMFHALYGLQVASLRVFMVYGPGQRDGAKLLPYVIRTLLQDRSPELSSGRRRVDWVYIDDVVSAFLAAACAEPIVGTAVDVGSGHPVTIRSLVERIVAEVGGEARPTFGARADRPAEREPVADVTRTEQLLGWAPTTPLDVGVARTVEWFRAQREAEITLARPRARSRRPAR
jgi:UDP-glucose 4-epimerase